MIEQISKQLKLDVFDLTMSEQIFLKHHKDIILPSIFDLSIVLITSNMLYGISNSLLLRSMFYQFIDYLHHLDPCKPIICLGLLNNHYEVSSVKGEIYSPTKNVSNIIKQVVNEFDNIYYFEGEDYVALFDLKNSQNNQRPCLLNEFVYNLTRFISQIDQS